MTFVRLRILFVMLQNTNKCSGAVAGERQLHYLRTQSSSYLFPFLYCYLNPLPMEQPSFPQLSTPMGEFSEPLPPSSSNHELDPGFIAMVRKQPFSKEIHEDPYEHLQEFEELCSGLEILGMTQEALRWKLFSILFYREGRVMVHSHDRKYER